MSFELVTCVTARERTFRESAVLEQKAVFRNLRLDRGASTPHKLATVEGAASLLQARCLMARYYGYGVSQPWKSNWSLIP
jgi:hypothetical protein